MPCKTYKNALIETAASGAEPQGDLRAHLAGCADCRAAFEQERSLFASIDAGLHVTANAEVPASLLPRLRARLGEESAPRRIWASNWLVLASAAVMVVAIFAARAVWRTNVIQQPVVKEVKATVPPHVTVTPQNHDPAVEPLVKKDDVSKHRLAIANNQPVHETPVGRKTMPEVLVPHDSGVFTSILCFWLRSLTRPF
jgi:anti-sigma factor RsiW